MLKPNWVPPFLTAEKITEEAEEFRCRHCPGHAFPLNIGLVVEKQLGLELIPISGMKALAGTSAYLKSDFTGIVVDLREFQDDRYEPRLRFSIAHEVGHYVLHREDYRRFKVHSAEDYIDLMQNIPDQAYGRFELQANRFAAALLVPREYLVEVVSDAKKKIMKSLPKGREVDLEDVLGQIAPSVARFFGVSMDCISRRFKDEDISKGRE